MRQHTSTSINLYTSFSGRCSSDGAVSAQLLDNDTSSSTTHYFASNSILPQSRGFEIHGISTRELSSDAVQATSPRDMHNYFFYRNDVDARHKQHEEDALLNPILNIIDAKKKALSNENVAFFELFKAISTLDRQPTAAITEESSDNSILDADENSVGGIGTTPTDDVNRTVLSIAKDDEQKAEEQSKETMNNTDSEKQALNSKLDQMLKRNKYRSVMKILESHENYLTRNN